MLPQQIITILIILVFVFKLFKQKQKAVISRNELIFWLFFWFLASIAIIFIKQIDYFLSSLGVSASGINFLFYLGVLVLFYFIFRLRLNLAKLDRQLTDLSRQIAIKEAKDKYQD